MEAVPSLLYLNGLVALAFAHLFPESDDARRREHELGGARGDPGGVAQLAVGGPGGRGGGGGEGRGGGRLGRGQRRPRGARHGGGRVAVRD